jgi:hypothetical protein
MLAEIADLKGVSELYHMEVQRTQRNNRDLVSACNLLRSELKGKSRAASVIEQTSGHFDQPRTSTAGKNTSVEHIVVHESAFACSPSASTETMQAAMTPRASDIPTDIHSTIIAKLDRRRSKASVESHM